ncbi:leucyl aminopeptidase [Vespertiliibacter pulmonis]|uniref:Probable cytosol aminopeptidase n=1 Tax=Vespertiliibacter pulmonis TaxID=1443036 RepID=A0A3N4VDR8_9PAST|nr:leucyl aminopeptidase [Vespertiliibacter pulmonis]QLB20476.1 leucyl aminopeptidase [Vespertiliibacter pulmonis]RPE80778.1 leucyl aminopeptidase [Vespertiliibacter pulmonis]
MEFSVKNGSVEKQRTACLVVGVYEPRRLSSAAEQLDKLSEGYISALLKKGDLEGKVGQTLLLHHLPNVPAERVLLVGCGKERELTERQYKQVIQTMLQVVNNTGSTEIVCCLTELHVKARSIYWNVRFAVEAMQEASYSYTEFKSIKPEVHRELRKVAFNIASRKELSIAEQALEQGKAVASGVIFAKNVANCPPNVCTPEYLANCARKLAESYEKITTTVVDEEEMKTLGMNAYLAVSQGSQNPAYMSLIHYNNHPDPKAKPIVLVGKGMTFDSGGISIKPSAAMDEMKYDMGGAASVYGTMKAIAEMKLPLNVIGILAGCENMPDGNAYRPGDILTTMSGLTVEVLNTDAEGRLVLCDVLTYVERFDPELVIDVATLTGACVVALGMHTTGLISTHNSLAHDLLNASEQADDRAWRLPMGEDYQEQLKSNFADLANIGGSYGGAITAGVFLSNFAKKYTWAHLDIAGTAWKTGAAKGATGRPVPMLSQFLIEKALEK